MNPLKSDRPNKRIALLGSAPSSVALAPFNDRSWTIWSCSPGATKHLQRTDAHFELHRYVPGHDWAHPDYIRWMADLKCHVFMQRKTPDVPNSVAYPKDQVLNYIYGEITGPDGQKRGLKFDPNTFGSSLSWMLALAIMQDPDEIGLWGVDMAATEEYGLQKDGCLSLIHAAKSIGIKITVPPESDLLRPAPLYGMCETDPMHIKLRSRGQEIEGLLAQARHDLANLEKRVAFFEGALDNHRYVYRTWVADPVALARAYEQPTREAPVIETSKDFDPPAIMPQDAVMTADDVEEIMKPAKARRKAKANGIDHEVA